LTNGQHGIAASALATREQPRDCNEQHGTHGGSRQTPPESEPADADPSENPATDNGADQAQDNVNDASEAPPARKVTGEPSRQQADDDPRDYALRRDSDDHFTFTLKQQTHGGDLIHRFSPSVSRRLDIV
jgi:hypothetical protein